MFHLKTDNLKRFNTKGFIYVCIVLLYAGICLALRGKKECFYYSHFGIFCPGCGMTRAFDALIHLNFRETIHHNAAIFVFPFALYAIYTNGEIFKEKWANNTLLTVIALVFITQWIVKLVCGYP